MAISQRYGEDRIPGRAGGARGALATLGWELFGGSARGTWSYDDYVGEAYGAATAASSAMRLAARTEGLLLTRTPRAMAGLIDHARCGVVGQHSTVVFIHTGGLPGDLRVKDEIIDWLDRDPELIGRDARSARLPTMRVRASTRPASEEELTSEPPATSGTSRKCRGCGVKAAGGCRRPGGGRAVAG